MCPTLLQLLETVVKASAIISLAAKTSHNLNSTLSFPFTTVTFPVIRAWALIKFQSSNLGFIFAISGACKNASLLNGLKRPEVLKLFSTIIDISDPIFSFFKTSSKNILDFSSIDKGETAKGSGFKFPLVISTSIKAKALNGINAIKNKII